MDSPVSNGPFRSALTWQVTEDSVGEEQESIDALSTGPPVDGSPDWWANAVPTQVGALEKTPGVNVIT